MTLINQFVTFPVETQIAIAGLVGLLVTLVFNYIGGLAPWSVPFLEKWKPEIVAALAGVFTGWLANILPGGEFEQVSILGVNFVIALIVALLAYGTQKLYVSVRAKRAK